VTLAIDVRDEVAVETELKDVPFLVGGVAGRAIESARELAALARGLIFQTVSAKSAT
jgi:hypothetical protein